jgi:hypothetical protein
MATCRVEAKQTRILLPAEIAVGPTRQRPEIRFQFGTETKGLLVGR